MATIPSPSRVHGADAEIDYPTGDGRPVGETPIHRDNLLIGVKTLERHFISEPMVYVSGNMFVFYEQGNPRKHVSPDVFVARGVPKDTPRDAYFIWEERHGLDFVVELTSKTTRGEDFDHKMTIYRDEIVVPEYFLFDPKGEYLDPPLQGYRLREGRYVRIDFVQGRLPSETIGLHLEADGEWLRFYNPATGRRLPTPDEREAELEAQRERERTARERAEVERERERTARKRAEEERERERTARERERTARERADAERHRLSAELRSSAREIEHLRRELEQWQRQFGDRPQPPGGAEE